MNLYRKDHLLGSWILSGVEGNQGQSITTFSLGCQSRSRIFDFEIINLTARGRGSCGGCCCNEPVATKGSAAAQLTAAAGRELIQISPRVICLFVRCRLCTLKFTANSEKNSFGTVFFWLIVATFFYVQKYKFSLCVRAKRIEKVHHGSWCWLKWSDIAVYFWPLAHAPHCFCVPLISNSLRLYFFYYKDSAALPAAIK